jgi:hypothetical protein
VIRLKFAKAESVLEALSSLSNNFMVKNLTLLSPTEVDEETIKFADQFKSQRVALKITLNTSVVRFKARTESILKTYYPENYFENNYS